MLERAILGAGGRPNRPPVTHQDEFPAEYSLAGCSPAEPASASPATLILVDHQPVRLANCSERQLSPSARVSNPAAVHTSVPDYSDPIAPGQPPNQTSLRWAPSGSWGTLRPPRPRGFGRGGVIRTRDPLRPRQISGDRAFSCPDNGFRFSTLQPSMLNPVEG